MKTVTEFPAPTLKNAAKTQADLTAAGKTAEELPQAMGEALKLEGDKLTFTLAAIEVVGTRINDLKRIVVLSLAEGEKAPSGAVQKGEHYFVSEYYPPIHKPGQGPKKEGKGRGEFGKRGDKKGGRRGEGRGKGRDGDKPGEGRGPRGPRPPRNPGGPRGPRPGADASIQAADGAPKKVIVIKPVVRPAAAPEAAATTEKQETNT